MIVVNFNRHHLSSIKSKTIEKMCESLSFHITSGQLGMGQGMIIHTFGDNY
ncbi:unnamed protein product [Spirodela intermedia]|uniref:Uncharacterized protein n=1 Tax=Spirodela intermedia TaxID=51605 RepID=A0A7I8JR46_SPIIN|nr:unnamed protein product [Spirodela intermedia]CAA6672638.1 unnamed protein product [Spirodela intermedia]